MTLHLSKSATLPLGIVMKRQPGVTRWAKWSWKATGVMPGARSADWKVLRQDGDVTEYHAATLELTLHAAETEAYLHGLAAQVPSIYVLLRHEDNSDTPLNAVLVTASPYEAQDYADNGEDIVEKIPMPAGLIAFVEDFATANHEEEEFKKRRRDRVKTDLIEDGVGDARIPQLADVYRAPGSARKERLQ